MRYETNAGQKINLPFEEITEEEFFLRINGMYLEDLIDGYSSEISIVQRYINITYGKDQTKYADPEYMILGREIKTATQENLDIIWNAEISNFSEFKGIEEDEYEDEEDEYEDEEEGS